MLKKTLLRCGEGCRHGIKSKDSKFSSLSLNRVLVTSRLRLSLFFYSYDFEIRVAPLSIS